MPLEGNVIKALTAASIMLGFVVAGERLVFPSLNKPSPKSTLRPAPCAYLLARLLFVAWSVHMFVSVVLMTQGHAVDMRTFRGVSMVLLSLNMMASTAILALRVLVLRHKRQAKRLMCCMIIVLLSAQLLAGAVSTYAFASTDELEIDPRPIRMHGCAVAQFAVTLALDLFFAGIVVATIRSKDSQVRDCRVLRLLLIDAVVYLSLSFLINVVTIVALFAWRHSLLDTIITIRVNVLVCTAIACRIFRSQLAFFETHPANSSSSPGLSALRPRSRDASPSACPRSDAQPQYLSADPPRKGDDGPSCTTLTKASSKSWTVSTGRPEARPPLPEDMPPSLRVQLDEAGWNDSTLRLDEFVLVEPRGRASGRSGKSGSSASVEAAECSGQSGEAGTLRIVRTLAPTHPYSLRSLWNDAADEAMAGLELPQHALEPSLPFAKIGHVRRAIDSTAARGSRLEALRPTSGLSSAATDTNIDDPALQSSEHEYTPAASPCPALAGRVAVGDGGDLDGPDEDGAGVLHCAAAKSSAHSLIDAAISPRTRMVFDASLGRYVVDDGGQAAIRVGEHQLSGSTIVVGRISDAKHGDATPRSPRVRRQPRSVDAGPAQRGNVDGAQPRHESL
ncbi:uncharacterized protein PSFLO_01958 [Pseudozyma flocculosa]|uniref:Uncharacterized protein n=1 Tax=Pseudozyma flocculosa TaxID=84751 RepID=A0A5C3EYL7_9BASI|nr:uncharacterized protein PSFLO_01958 [Pseudozyma flocculosa]